jgi:hypothetical protein
MARTDFANTVTYGESDFTYDSDYIEYDDGFKLKLQDNPGQNFTEDFADDTDFTYDSDYVEFSGGQMQQKDQTPNFCSNVYNRYQRQLGRWRSCRIGCRESCYNRKQA